MTQGSNFRKIILLFGDIILLYASVLIALTIRNGSFPSRLVIGVHIMPFSIINALFILIIYITGLYDITKKNLASFVNIAKTMTANAVIAIMLFYLIPYFGIAPKTNLLADVIISSLLLWGWRKIFLVISKNTGRIKVVFFGDSKEMVDFADYLNNNPQLKYEVANIPMGNGNNGIQEILKNQNVDIVVVSELIKNDKEMVKMFYKILSTGITIINFDKFYESITGKIPVSLISEAWFLENLVEINKQVFERFKRWIDIVLAVIFLVPTIILFPFIAILIKVDSSGSIFYRQKRIGKNGKIFEITKFRSMIENAEKNGAEWAKKDDMRITFIGNIIRKTRLDELPQIWNVLKGELSFVGPRPERPEFVKELTEKIPHYPMRYLVKPGLSGWAQINFPYGASIEDATEKLQYDLYYIKNRSLLLEISILLKTIMTVAQHSGR